MPETPKKIHVIGGGLAGLAAALRLAEWGCAVTLYEAGPACGGRCRSYFDRDLGCRIDNGNHLLLSGNRDAMAYLDMLGTRHTLGGPAKPVFPFVDLVSGERWTLRPNLGPIPWWLLDKRRCVPGARLADYAGLLRLRGAAADATVSGTLTHGALYRRLIEPLAIAALNTPPDQGSARLLWAVLAETLARGGANYIPRFPRDGLSESFVDPAVARLRARGADIKTSFRIAALGVGDGRVISMTGPEGTCQAGPADRVVLAVPSPVAAGLLPDLVTPDEHQAIVNLHYRFAADPGEAGFVGLVGGLAEWVFIKPGIVSVTISAANRLLDESPETLAETCWRESCHALGIVADLPPWRLIREKRATFAATPLQQQRRPSATLGLSNLVLAGDWMNTELPATIEGAIRSGFAAAQLVNAA